MGFGEVLLILLSLGGFGVKPNPNAPPPEAISRYALDDADAMVFTDFEAVVPHNWDYFVKLPGDATIKTVPAVQGELARLVKQAEEGRAMLKLQLGMDVVTDVKWGAAWIRYRPKGDPEFVAVVGGKFPADFIDKASAMGKQKVVKIAGRSAIEDDGAVVAVTADGTLIAGTAALARARLAATWKPAVRAGSVTARAAELVAERPFFFAAFRPSPALVKYAEAEMKGADLALFRDFVSGHEFFGVVMTATTFGWTSVLRTPTGYARALMASEGTIQIIRAGHLFLRGAAQVVLASLDSYVPVDPSLAKVIKHKAELLRLVNSWTGDGNFAVKLDKDPARKRIAVRLTGKTLAEVFPIGAVVVPAALGGLFFASRAMPPAIDTPPPPPGQKPR